MYTGRPRKPSCRTPGPYISNLLLKPCHKKTRKNCAMALELSTFVGVGVGIGIGIENTGQLFT